MSASHQLEFHVNHFCRIVNPALIATHFGANLCQLA
jgi:hypothetical protein